MKRQLFEMAGTKGGLDMNQKEKAQVVEFIQGFKGKGRPDPENVELTGTEWSLLFTESESAGCICCTKLMRWQPSLVASTLY